MQREIFPREVTSGVPRITLTGRERLLVEQHRGLVGCTDREIRLDTASGLLIISGEHLLFLRYSQTEALISGRIDAVCLGTEGRRS